MDEQRLAGPAQPDQAIFEERPTTKAGQREATIRRLILAGRTLFTAHGYSQTATEDLVQRAGVTRGALYHHFANKAGLFYAVLEAVQQDVADRIAQAVAQADDPWEQLVIGCRAFLEASLDPEVQRIMLIDGPAVLGWDAWRAIDAEHSMRLLEDGLNGLAEEGVIAGGSAKAAAHLLSGAMNEAALWIARSAQPQQALSETTTALERLLAGLRQER